MMLNGISYHKAADKYVKTYYEKKSELNIFYSYRFMSLLAKEAKHIAKSLSLKGMDYQNAIVATWFRYAGIKDIEAGYTPEMAAILKNFLTETGYPVEDRELVEKAIVSSALYIDAESQVQKVVADAVNSHLAAQGFFENMLLINSNLNRLNEMGKTELHYAEYFINPFIRSRYYTNYASENYSLHREHNFHLLEKRIDRLRAMEKSASKADSASILTNKETEDLFKVAFRNYNHLVSVADSKASLLIHVNSIIISVMLAFVLGRIERNMFLLWPAILLLTVSITTILLSILASKPQKNTFMEDKHCVSYQQFFFGSFDLIDTSFRKANWDQYYLQLNELFNNPKENVYLEVYKESFNVRKVLSKKFSYLSQAYWVFIIGLLISIIAFLVAVMTLKPA